MDPTLHANPRVNQILTLLSDGATRGHSLFSVDCTHDERYTGSCTPARPATRHLLHLKKMEKGTDVRVIPFLHEDKAEDEIDGMVCEGQEWIWFWEGDWSSNQLLRRQAAYLTPTRGGVIRVCVMLSLARSLALLPGDGPLAAAYRRWPSIDSPARNLHSNRKDFCGESQPTVESDSIAV